MIGFLLLVAVCHTVQATPVGAWWRGFSKIENVFAFGDSWTSTEFNHMLEQPSASNPLGNPAFPGLTTTNGANYIGYLTSKYNESLLYTYDFAIGGSVIDPEYHPPMLSWLYLQTQVGIFKHQYTEIGQHWSPENTLFTAFFGINDVVVYDRTNPQLKKVFTTYQKMIGELYELGARNFLILNIPPIDIVSASQAEQYVWKQEVYAFNMHINSLVNSLRNQYADATIFLADIHTLFEEVLQDPSSHTQTAGYKNLTHYCEAYAKDLKYRNDPQVAGPDQLDKCDGLKVEEYLWLDGLHVSWPIHDAMAAVIADLLSSTPEFLY